MPDVNTDLLTAINTELDQLAGHMVSLQEKIKALTALRASVEELRAAGVALVEKTNILLGKKDAAPNATLKAVAPELTLERECIHKGCVQPRVVGKKYCSEHYELFKADQRVRAKQWYKDKKNQLTKDHNRKQIRYQERQNDKELCGKCPQPRVEGKKFCAVHLEKLRVYKRDSARKIAKEQKGFRKGDAVPETKPEHCPRCEGLMIEEWEDRVKVIKCKNCSFSLPLKGQVA